MLSKAQVLLVDDEPLVLEMFESFLLQQGYDVVVASNARDALVNLERRFFDVIVCDVMLENLDGFDLLTIARTKNAWVGVVLITGAPSQADMARAHALNSLYLSKPVGFDILLTSIEQAIDNSREERSKVAT